MNEELETLAAAIEKNGWKQIRGGLFEVEGHKLVGACALGQAALNLDIVSEEEVVFDHYAAQNKAIRELGNRFDKFKINYRYHGRISVIGVIWRENDYKHRRLKTIANLLRESVVEVEE